MKTDTDLIRSYAEEASEEAFAEIVRRHVDLVYGVALRQLGGNVALAQDTTQAVFTALASKADAIRQIRHLAGWLYGTARFTASHSVRAERRRQTRERKAQTMHNLLSEPEPRELAAVPPEMFDEVLEKLDATDREAILLRFFEGQPFLAVGTALRVSEDAARVRVARALEKIRVHFARQGITSSAAAVGAALANQAIAAPPGLAASVSATALTGTAALVAPTSAKVGLITLMTTTKTTTWLAGAVGLMTLGFSGYQYREAAIHRESLARLTIDRNNLAAALKKTEQRIALIDARATLAEQRSVDLEGKLSSALSAKAQPIAKRATDLDSEARKIAAEKMAKMKPLLEAGMPIKGAVIVLVDGKPVQRPVEFVMGKETRIESVDDGTYVITPALNPDGSVRYSIKVVKLGSDGTEQKVGAQTNVTQTPWGGFTLGSGSGRAFGFDPDKGEP